jgi:DtxR family transcriptional regulator, Mn-dependent transcriptional regulator
MPILTYGVAWTTAEIRLGWLGRDIAVVEGASAEQLSASLEDYLEAIFRVVQEKQAALPKDIRKILRVGRSSVSGALKVLVDRGLIDHDPYGVITLTDTGTTIAGRLVQRHEILRDFLVKVLTVEAKEADENACRMEHAVSESVLNRLVEFAEFVDRCPRAGAKWVRGFGYYCENASTMRNCEKCVELVLSEVRERNVNSTTSSVPTEALSNIRPGNRATIDRVEGRSGIRQRLLDMGITKGAVVTVERIAPLGDPMQVKVKGYHLTLRKEEAKRILVKPL